MLQSFAMYCDLMGHLCSVDPFCDNLQSHHIEGDLLDCLRQNIVTCSTQIMRRRLNSENSSGQYILFTTCIMFDLNSIQSGYSKIFCFFAALTILTNLDAREDQRATPHFEGGLAALITILQYADFSLISLFVCLFVCCFSNLFIGQFFCLLLL